MPRPTKLNAKRADQTCNSAAQRHTCEVAGQACRIVSTRLYRWIKRGDRGLFDCTLEVSRADTVRLAWTERTQSL